MTDGVSSPAPHGPDAAQTTPYEIVIIGGGFAGSSSALLLRQLMPEANILILERTSTFDRKVGEATIELSAYFLEQVLGIDDHLATEHLPKHGLRYWFTDGPERQLREMTEVGGIEPPRLPAFQLERARLDEYLLEKAGVAGAEIKRGARVENVDQGEPESIVTYTLDGQQFQAAARWIVDASGRAGLLANQFGQRRFFEEMSTAAVWARWQNVADMDAAGSHLFASDMPTISAARRLATNHFCGYGWWCWVIPLGSGETSIGLVYDKRLFDPGLDDGGPKRAYQRFLATQPGLRELIADARMVEDDFNLHRRLAYTTDAYAGKGWALVADAASFLDPFYSPGLDHASISVFATAELIAKDIRDKIGEAALDEALSDHNALFARSIRRWLDAIYVDKYEIMGDAELMRCSFMIDTALYYLGVVAPVIRDRSALGHPVFGLPVPQTRYAAGFMRFCKSRLVKLARYRLQTGCYGRRNIGWYAHGRAFDLRWRSIGILLKALVLWAGLELDYLRHRLRGGGADVSKPAVLRDLSPAPTSRRKAMAG
ncbi:MAG: NAD(P)/FAD-dependent oxidoreductase [Geminicoccaceae bacterium]